MKNNFVAILDLGPAKLHVWLRQKFRTMANLSLKPSVKLHITVLAIAVGTSLKQSNRQ